jgi:hypothetical protein
MGIPHATCCRVGVSYQITDEVNNLQVIYVVPSTNYVSRKPKWSATAAKPCNTIAR